MYVNNPLGSATYNLTTSPTTSDSLGRFLSSLCNRVTPLKSISLSLEFEAILLIGRSGPVICRNKCDRNIGDISDVCMCVFKKKSRYMGFES